MARRYCTGPASRIAAYCIPSPSTVGVAVKNRESKPGISRREMLGAMGKSALGVAVMHPLLQTKIFNVPARTGATAPVNGTAGIVRVVVLPGKTYLRGWAGHGEPPRPGARRPAADSTPPAPAGPTPAVRWSKQSGPGRVSFANAKELKTTANFSAPGVYVLALTADDGQSTATSTP